MGVTRSIIARGLVILTSIFAGCDEGDIRIDDPSMPVQTQPNAARIALPPAALAKLYDLENPDGFVLRAEPEIAWTDGVTSISYGPLEQTLSVAERSAEVDGEELVLTTAFRDLIVLIPVRVQDASGLRICRYRVRALALQIVTRLQLDPAEGRFQVVDTPLVITRPEDILVNEVGGCAFASDAWGDAAQELDANLLEFTLEALASSAESAFGVEPLPLAGILTGRVEIDRRAPFTNRRGTIAVQNDLREVSGLSLDDEGLQVALELGVAARRAGCVPPVEIDAPGLASVEAPSLDEVKSLGADFAMALSNESLSRVLQALTLAGFACRGLEDSRSPETNEELIATDDVRFQDLGLNVPLGPWVRIVSSPGALPSLRTRPWAGDIQLTWEKLTLEFYGDVDGAPVRIATLTANIRASLRPRRNTVGFVRLEVDALDLTRVSFDSPWLASPPETATMEQWAQRAVLLILSQEFVIPLPLNGNAAVRVAGSQIRDDDVTLYLVVDASADAAQDEP